MIKSVQKKDDACREGAHILVYECAQVKAQEHVLIISNDSTYKLADCILNEAKQITPNIRIVNIKETNMHGLEPPANVAAVMLEANIIFGLTKFSLAHTEARINATKKGVRYLSLPDYDFEQLKSQALRVNFSDQARISAKIKKLLDAASKVKITTLRGSFIELNIYGRVANSCPGFCDKNGVMGSPPDIEVNIAPVEDRSNGTIVIDGSIPCGELGLIKEDIIIAVKEGSLEKIHTNNSQSKILKNILETDNKYKVLAEFGIGLNPKAKLCGRMLEDEGCMGTIHFGFGSNTTIGGKNKVNFHIDFVIKAPSIIVDNLQIMENGILSLDF